MSTWSPTYRQSVRKFLRVLPTRWRRKPAGIDMERNHVTVTLCIPCGRWTYSNIAYSVDFVPRTDINLLNQHLSLNFRFRQASLEDGAWHGVVCRQYGGSSNFLKFFQWHSTLSTLALMAIFDRCLWLPIYNLYSRRNTVAAINKQKEQISLYQHRLILNNSRLHRLSENIREITVAVWNIRSWL